MTCRYVLHDRAIKSVKTQRNKTVNNEYEQDNMYNNIYEHEGT